jgi:hypothetical protein
VITVDKNAAYPPAFGALQQDSTLPETCRLRQCKYLNNMIEQDHRFVKRLVNPGLGFGAFATAQRTIQGEVEDKSSSAWIEKQITTLKDREQSAKRAMQPARAGESRWSRLLAVLSWPSAQKGYA